MDPKGSHDLEQSRKNSPKPITTFLPKNDFVGAAVSTPRMPKNTSKSRRKEYYIKVTYWDGSHPTTYANTPWAPSVPERIEYAMRRDTAAPSLCSLA